MDNCVLKGQALHSAANVEKFSANARRSWYCSIWSAGRPRVVLAT